tara:strand:- start:23 stop:142 length:120 start_codon:yes stop_codon:yes gene_type:complete
MDNWVDQVGKSFFILKNETKIYQERFLGILDKLTINYMA